MATKEGSRTLMRSTAFLILVLGVLGTSPATAGGWGLSLGLFDLSRDNEAVEGGIDYRSGPWGRYRLTPFGHLGFTEEEGVFGTVGLRRPFEIGPSRRWIVEPSFGVSLYDDGDGKDLGGPVEFRSGLDVRLRLRSGVELGLGFYHLSNAGIYEHNPGTNSLLLRVLLPERRR